MKLYKFRITAKCPESPKHDIDWVIEDTKNHYLEMVDYWKKKVPDFTDAKIELLEITENKSVLEYLADNNLFYKGEVKDSNYEITSLASDDYVIRLSRDEVAELSENLKQVAEQMICYIN